MSGKLFTTLPNGYIEPQVAASGYASLPPKTVIEVFQDTLSLFPDEGAYYYKAKIEGTLAKEYTKVTYREYWSLCMKFAKALVKLQIEMYNVINILGFNSPEWFIANTGANLAACIPAGIYTTNSPEACKYITEHGKAQVVVLEGNKQLVKYVEMASQLPALRAIVVWGEEPDQQLIAKIESSSSNIKVFAWNEFLLFGSELPDSSVDIRWAFVQPGNCASLIYTSGTTGPPKAVMISHDNLTWTAKNIIDHYMDLNHTDRCITYLPLSHIAAQLTDIHCVMKLGASTWFAQPDALKGSLTVTMREVKPTYFFAVPRVWEKIQEKMAQMGRESSQIAQYISSWAKYIGTEKSKMNQYGECGGVPFGYGCINAAIFRKLKEALGLDQTKGCFTAAAPIAPETLWYFASLDIPVLEVFGQSECTGPHTVSGANAWKIGACGRPIAGTQSKLDPVTGELCYRGRHIFMGYMYMDKETREAIDDEGYLHSGDVGEFDKHEDPNIPSPSGFLKITGRIKELIITAGGENVPPLLIENEMKAAMLPLSNCMVIGDKKKFLTMLISIKVEMDSETGIPKDELAADSLYIGHQIGSSAKTYTEVKKDPLWKAYIDKGMAQGNKKTTSNAQIIQKWAWLPVDFSEKGGELTPTLKLKRKFVSDKYTTLINQLYGDDK